MNGYIHRDDLAQLDVFCPNCHESTKDQFAKAEYEAIVPPQGTVCAFCEAVLEGDEWVGGTE